MRIATFYESLTSDWNQGGAHFLRGVVGELLDRGHDVVVLEPRNGASLRSLARAFGAEAMRTFRSQFPRLRTVLYDLETLDLDAQLTDVDLVVVHHRTALELVRRLDAHRAAGGTYRLLYHDTSDRVTSIPQGTPRPELAHFDGVLAAGRAIRDGYLARGWTGRAWTWHEAADLRLFHPMAQRHDADLVWIANWPDGGEDDMRQMQEFFVAPVKELGIRASVFGARFCDDAVKAFAEARIHHGGWLPSLHVPATLARHRVSLHLPRPAWRQPPGAPSIRLFEALACGVPVVSAPWDDVDGLFTPGEDYLLAHDGREMVEHLRTLLHDTERMLELMFNGFKKILDRHTCGHRAAELLTICEELGVDTSPNPVLPEPGADAGAGRGGEATRFPDALLGPDELVFAEELVEAAEP